MAQYIAVSARESSESASSPSTEVAAPTLTLTAAGLTGLAMVTGAGLAGWRGWLQLRRAELEQGHAPGQMATSPGGGSAGARIEIADLRERIRKLEAIAAGIDV